MLPLRTHLDRVFKTVLVDKKNKEINENSISKEVQDEIFVSTHARTVSVSLHFYPGQWNRQGGAKSFLILHQSLNLIITLYCYPRRQSATLNTVHNVFSHSINVSTSFGHSLTCPQI